MSELLPLSIGIGLAVSLLFSELFGLAAGGMVVPGYVALKLHEPLEVATTIGVGLLTFAIVRGLSRYLIIYGKRRTVMMILVGYVLGAIVEATIGASSPTMDLQLIGYVIPGLIAIWLDRQGVIETLSALMIAAVVVRLCLVLVAGRELMSP